MRRPSRPARPARSTGLVDFNEYRVGTNTIWTPVTGLPARRRGPLHQGRPARTRRGSDHGLSPATQRAFQADRLRGHLGRPSAHPARLLRRTGSVLLNGVACEASRPSNLWGDQDNVAAISQQSGPHIRADQFVPGQPSPACLMAMERLGHSADAGWRGSGAGGRVHPLRDMRSLRGPTGGPGEMAGPGGGPDRPTRRPSLEQAHRRFPPTVSRGHAATREWPSRIS